MRIINLSEAEVNLLEGLLDDCLETSRDEFARASTDEQRGFWRKREALVLSVELKLFPQTFATTAHELKRLLKDPRLAHAMTTALERYMAQLETDAERQAIRPLYELAKAQAQALTQTIDLQEEHKEQDAQKRK